MNKEELIEIIRGVVREELGKKRKRKIKYSPEAREVMVIFWKRDKLLNFKRTDYWDSAEALVKTHGVDEVKAKLAELDSMTEFRPDILNPSDLRNKWFKIKSEIKKSKYKQL